MAKLPTINSRKQACLRPRGKPVMFQTWTDLAFLHWEFEADEIAATLPPGLHVDTHEGKAYVGLVPFYMRNIRLKGLPMIPGNTNFLEMNVRTYVHDTEGRPGVWFYSLDATNSLACVVAQAKYHLPYYHAKISAQREADWIDYRCQPKRGDSRYESRVRYQGDGNDVSGAPGSLEYFLAERYLLFAWQEKRKRLFTGRVHHTPYRLETAEVNEYRTGAMTWCGFDVDGRPPDQAHFSKGVNVDIFSLKPAE
ncbi:MAG: hypothetical protein CMO61_01310 [Verrucomicrobiales bacterium]|nr:hypothetical protein [Verrucomicrobiales bacterium]